MESYICNYTLQEVKDAVNRCLKFIYSKENDNLLKDYFNNNLPTAMKTISEDCFVYGKYRHKYDDVELIKQAFIQLNAVGYVGKRED